MQDDTPLCGESVGRGFRVLVRDRAGNIVATVGKRHSFQTFTLAVNEFKTIDMTVG